jgi:hypothetical protein
MLTRRILYGLRLLHSLFLSTIKAGSSHMGEGYKSSKTRNFHLQQNLNITQYG